MIINYLNPELTTDFQVDIQEGAGRSKYCRQINFYRLSTMILLSVPLNALFFVRSEIISCFMHQSITAAPAFSVVVSVPHCKLLFYSSYFFFGCLKHSFAINLQKKD